MTDPSRNPVTATYYPDQVTAQAFIELLTPELLQHFVRNMQDLKCDHRRYPEEWMELLTQWAEFNR